MSRRILWDGEAAYRAAQRLDLPRHPSHTAAGRRTLAVALLFAAVAKKTSDGWRSGTLRVAHAAAILGIPKRAVERAIRRVEGHGWFSSWQRPKGDGHTGPSGWGTAVRRWGRHCAALRALVFRRRRARRTVKPRAARRDQVPARLAEPRSRPLPPDPESGSGYAAGIALLESIGWSPPA